MINLSKQFKTFKNVLASNNVLKQISLSDQLSKQK